MKQNENDRTLPLAINGKINKETLKKTQTIIIKINTNEKGGR